MYNESYQRLNLERQQWQNEEEVRRGWLRELESTLNILFHAERGRADADYNQVIIEFKDKGLFRGRTDSPKFHEAIYERLARYIPEKAQRDRLSPSDYVGIAIDGDHVAFAYFPANSDTIVHGQLMPLSVASVSLVMDTCKNSTRRAVTDTNLIEDFGHASHRGSALMQIFAEQLSLKLNATENSKIKMLFHEWKTLYGQVANLSEPQTRVILQTIGFDCDVQNEDRFSAILFTIHTYNSLIMKLLAAEIVSKINAVAAYSDFAQYAATRGDDELIDILDREIEHAGFYSRANIQGFVEEPLFSWYIDAYHSEQNVAKKESFSTALREVLIRLSSYLISDLSHARTNDVLKLFYQNLVPETLRKSLGEFYTPDWLVDFTLDKVEGRFAEQRFLDPTCGSASFLLAVIKRIKAESEGVSSAELLQIILANVWGFDLNPLAVQTARVNYLIAIADLIADNPGAEIEIPILLADAIYSPAPTPEAENDVVTYTIGSQIADLTITLPTELASDRERLDRVFQSMSNSVEGDQEPDVALNLLVDNCCVTRQELDAWYATLENTYSRVLSLHRRNWNGIWFRIVRNYFWSSTAGEFDVIVGNPPWVRWSKLPELYRERVKPTCIQYDIFSATPYHGGNELDISAIITFTVSDKWLKDDGQLVFLLTQTLFQSASSAGFRRFKIGESRYISPLHIDDLKDIKPFPTAANKTSIFVARKVENMPTYPVTYTTWHPAPGCARIIPEHLAKETVLNRIRMERQEANPINGSDSPWAVLYPGEIESFQNLIGRTDWANGRKGITCDLNGVFFVNVVAVSGDGRLVRIETRPNAGKQNIGQPQRFWVEPHLLYPLIKGAREIKACKHIPCEELYAIVPNMGITTNAYENAANSMRTHNPRMKQYFDAYRQLLEQRSTYRTRMANAPFYAVYNVGNYTFAPWKVIWAEQPGNNGISAAVVHNATLPGIGEKVYIPDHKVYFADFTNPDHAYYLCGLLTCSVVQRFLQSYLITIQVGDILKNLRLPEYSAENEDHCHLIALVRQVHEMDDSEQRDALMEEISTIGNRIVLT